MLALPGHVEANLYERPDGTEVRDPRYLRHALDRDLDFPQILLTGELFGDFDVFANGVLNVCQSLVFRGTLRPAPVLFQAGRRAHIHSTSMPTGGGSQSHFTGPARQETEGGRAAFP